MSQKNQKILISESNDGLINKFFIYIHYIFGYDILLFSKNIKHKNLSKFNYNNYSNLKTYNFHHFFHRKGQWSKKIYDEVFSNLNLKTDDKVENTKFRILVKDIFQRSIGSFDELVSLAELNQDKYRTVKIRCSWNIVRSQIYKNFILKNEIIVSFSILTDIFGIFKQLIGKIVKNILSSSTTRSKSKSEAANYQLNSKVIFFPHKGIAYGDSFNKDYYYSSSKLSPLCKDNILHLEYGSFDPVIDKSYKERGLNFSFLQKPKAKDLIKYLVFNRKDNIFKTFKRISNQKMSSSQIVLLVYILTLCRFLVDFYIKKIKTLSNCKVALLGYDILFPKELAVALHKLKIKTIAIQERYAIVYAGNYNVVVDNYLVWGYKTKNMIEESIGESYVERYIVTGPPRSSKIATFDPKNNQIKRKKFVVYSNSPEPEHINENTLLNNWVNIYALLNDIKKLASKYKECDFIIRAKHTGWDKIDYFQNILQEINHFRNIEISSNYQKMDVSYSLLNDVYAIIGHHTSIADEGMFCKIPVLFHDFGPFTESIYAQNYRYGELDIFSNSSEDFQFKFYKYFIDEKYPEDFYNYLEDAYGDLNSCDIMKRISSSLEEFV